MKKQNTPASRVKSGKSVLTYIGVIFLALVVISAAAYVFLGDIIQEKFFSPPPTQLTRVTPTPTPPPPPPAPEPVAEPEVSEQDNASQEVSEDNTSAPVEVAGGEEPSAPEPIEEPVVAIPAPPPPAPVAVAEPAPKPMSAAKKPVKIAPKPIEPKPVAVKPVKKEPAPVAIAPVAKPSAAVSTPVPTGDLPPETIRANFSAYVALAKNEMNMGNEKNAQAYYLKAYDLIPNEEVAYNVALLYLYRNQPDMATDWIARSTITESDSYEIIAQMVSNGNYSSAKSAVDRKISSDRNGRIYYASATLKEAEGNLDGAAADYQEAMFRSGYDEYITYAYARVLDKAGRYSEARTYYAGLLTSDKRELSRSASARLESMNLEGL